jgi:methylmalonyl-CoA mutase
MSVHDKLFEQFPPVSTADWMNKIISDLKKADLAERITRTTSEGFEVKPFYRQEDTDLIPFTSVMPGEFPYVRGINRNGNNWLVRQNIVVEDYPAANKKSLDILMKGVDSLGFSISDPDSISEINIETLLKGIDIGCIEINFQPNGKAREILDSLLKSAGRQGVALPGIRGAIEADPLGRLMMNGSLCLPNEAAFDFLASMTADSSGLPHFRTIAVNGSIFKNAGTDIVKELAFTLSLGNEYMSQLTSRGISTDLAASKIGFCFGTGPDYFFEIAKLRAARLLWSTIVSGYNPEKAESSVMNIHCITGRRNKKAEEMHINILRTQTEAMSAVLGGTDSLTVEPFDISFRAPDEFSERIARNQQLILKEEAYFEKVADPLGGAYYLEKLTSLIAENSWRLFLEVEEKGGFEKALNKGYFKNIIVR